MCRYAGGKKKISQIIHEVITHVENSIDEDKPRPFFEPFCGMMSVALKFAADVENHINHREISVCDNNPDIIAFWKAVKADKWKAPPKMDQDVYEYYKNL